MKEFTCGCEKKLHRVPLETVEISENALEKLPKLLGAYRRIYLVADENTYEAAGKRTESLLREAGMWYRTCVLKTPALPTPEALGYVLVEACDYSAPQNVMEYSPLPDYILAVGAGTVNDLCRVASYRLHLPYGIAATAPSMDGYASALSPMILYGTKLSVKGTTPRHIIGDLSVLADAPYDMLLAGVGDMAGKYIAILDWELARHYTGEYYCETVADMVLDATGQCVRTAYHLKERNHETIQKLMEGLMVSGLGMAYTGVSRPASGAEHMIGHVFEVMDIKAGKFPNLHGLEVGEGTLAAAFLYRRIYQETQNRELKGLIEKYLPYFEELDRLYQTVKIPLVVTDKKKLRDGILAARTFRKRYTVLEYLGERGLLEQYAEDCAEQILKEG